MNPGATSERVYDALKGRIMAGEALPGEKLDPATFAGQLNSSVTPVREALHRLAGERMVDARTSEGFFTPTVNEPGLRDLYAWNEALLKIVVRAWPKERPKHQADALSVDIGRATAEFFDLFALGSTNREHAYQIDLANDRLATARAAERRILGDLESELRALAVSFDNDPTANLLKLVAAYHRRRRSETPAIVRAMYRI